MSAGIPEGGRNAIPLDAHLSQPVSGLGRTNSTASVVSVDGPGFAEARRIVIGHSAPDTNATQLTIPTWISIAEGDSLLAELWYRGRRADGGQGTLEFHFEQSSRPWTKSASRLLTTEPDLEEWQRAVIPILSAGTYEPGEAMVSLRLAYGRQTVEIGSVRLLHYGRRISFDELNAYHMLAQPTGMVTAELDAETRRQSLRGLGGNFAQPRYGRTEPMDDVGRWNLEHLNVAHARVGLPLNHWNPEPGTFRTDGPAGASLEALRMLAERGLPLVVSIWEGPVWMLGGRPEQSGRILAEENYDACIDAIARYLVTARDDYGVEPDYVSFNEPDYGINFRFTPAQMGQFILRAAPVFAEHGITTRWLAGDTANGRNLVDYVTPLLEDPEIAEHLGPISFHSWDALSVTDAQYRAIAALGDTYDREIWCLEAGHDAQLWRRPSPWGTWDNAFKTARAYARTIRLSGASLMSYWTYQDNYPLWNKATGEPYPVFHVMRQMEGVIRPGAEVAEVESGEHDLEILFTVGPGENDFALLVVNPRGPGEIEFSGLPSHRPVMVTTSTNERQDERRSGETTEEGRLRVPLPSLSVISVVVEPEV